jgi:hypothetical protein
MNTYIIINTSDLDSVDFSQVLQTSSSTTRKSNSGLLTVLKYTGNEPSSLVSITKVNVNGRDYHDNEQILEIMKTTGNDGWTPENPII